MTEREPQAHGLVGDLGDLRSKAALLLVYAVGAVGIHGIKPATASAEQPPDAVTPSTQLYGALGVAGALSEQVQIPSFTLDTNPAIVTKAYKTEFNDKRAPIMATPSGFVTGTATYGNTVSIEKASTSGKYVYGLIRGKICGWIESAVVDDTKVTNPDGPCEQFVGRLKYWSNVGKNFNGTKKAKRVDGSDGLEMTDECDREIFGNYASEGPSYNNMDYPDGDTGLINPDGKVPKGTLLHVRFWTPDGKAIRVRIDGVGWRSMDGDCADPNDPNLKTGPLKTKSTAPGAHPNIA